MWRSTLLSALNAVLGPIRVPRDGFVQAFLQYPTGGTGTLELQGSIDETNYVTVWLTPSNSATLVQNLAAAGAGSADVSGYALVQVKMTVAGSVTPKLGLPVV